jgi:hypothetical protein
VPYGGRVLCEATRALAARVTDARPPNKAMKLTRLSAAPGWFREHPAGGAASCPRRCETAGTASQLIASVRRTYAAIPRDAK